MASKDGSRTLQTTQTSLDIVEEIKRQKGARMADLAEALGLAHSTVHGHLKTLTKNGYLKKTGEIYDLDLKFLHLGEYTRRQREAFKIAERIVDELSERTEEEVDFSVEQDGRVLVVYMNSVGRPTFDVGDYYYMTTSAPGKAMLAEMPEERVEQIIDKWGFPKETEYTITERDRLSEEFERIRERGYSINDQEVAEGLRTISATITDVDRSVLGALTINGPTYRLQDDVLENELSHELLNAASDFEKSIRGDGPIEP